MGPPAFCLGISLDLRYLHLNFQSSYKEISKHLWHRELRNSATHTLLHQAQLLSAPNTALISSKSQTTCCPTLIKHIHLREVTTEGQLWQSHASNWRRQALTTRRHKRNFRWSLMHFAGECFTLGVLGNSEWSRTIFSPAWASLWVARSGNTSYPGKPVPGSAQWVILWKWMFSAFLATCHHGKCSER